MDQLSEIKQGARATWAAGNFDEVAEYILDVGRWIVERVGIQPGERVLDVGAGTGNAAIPAALAGGDVVASDLTPELFEAGRRRAREAGAELEWVEADAEALPFDDASFDVVLSTFGHMFAPRHALAAAEISRVLRPGGRIGLCCWDPTGKIGGFFRTVAKHVPPPPDVVQPPPMWGDPEHAAAMFEGTALELEFERQATNFDFSSAEEAVTMYEQKFGPVVMARKALEPQGRWEALRADLVAEFDSYAREDGSLDYDGAYLAILGTKPA